MSRNRHLVAYDIADDHRLRRVAKLMEKYGYRLQYSVFLCDLSRGELAAWRREATSELDLSVDSIVRIDLGAIGDAEVEMIGVPRYVPVPGPKIV